MHLQKNIPEFIPTVSDLPSQPQMWKKNCLFRTIYHIKCLHSTVYDEENILCAKMALTVKFNEKLFFFISSQNILS